MNIAPYLSDANVLEFAMYLNAALQGMAPSFGLFEERSTSFKSGNLQPECGEIKKMLRRFFYNLYQILQLCLKKSDE